MAHGAEAAMLEQAGSNPERIAAHRNNKKNGMYARVGENRAKIGRAFLRRLLHLRLDEGTVNLTGIVISTVSSVWQHFRKGS